MLLLNWYPLEKWTVYMGVHSVGVHAVSVYCIGMHSVDVPATVSFLAGYISFGCSFKRKNAIFPFLYTTESF